MEPIHVYPGNDIKPHEVEGNPCDCCPEIITADYDSIREVYHLYGSPIIVHNAWDKRL